MVSKDVVILFVVSAFAVFMAHQLWVWVPSNELLSVLWKFIPISGFITGVCYYSKTQYNDILKHPALTVSELDRLEPIVQGRKDRISQLFLMGFFITLALAVSELFQNFPLVSYWYFLIIVLGLAVNAVFFVFLWLETKEIEDFYLTLAKRQKRQENKQRQLKELRPSAEGELSQHKSTS